MQKSYVFFIYLKNKFFDIIKSWVEKVEIETQCKFKCLKINKKGEFICLSLKKFCNPKE